MPIIMIGLFFACLASAWIAPLVIILLTGDYWPVVFYVPYFLTVWFFKTTPAVYS